MPPCALEVVRDELKRLKDEGDINKQAYKRLCKQLDAVEEQAKEAKEAKEQAKEAKEQAKEAKEAQRKLIEVLEEDRQRLFVQLSKNQSVCVPSSAGARVGTIQATKAAASSEVTDGNMPHP